MSWDVFLLEEVDRWYQTLKELRPAATSIRILFVFVPKDRPFWLSGLR